MMVYGYKERLWALRSCILDTICATAWIVGSIFRDVGDFKSKTPLSWLLFLDLGLRVAIIAFYVIRVRINYLDLKQLLSNID